MNVMINMRYFRYALVFLPISILIGCASVPKTKISPSAAVKSSITMPKIAQPVENISGEWRGVMSCNGRNVIFDLTINNLDKRSIGASIRAKMPNSQIKSGEGTMVGTYDPDSSYFKLEQSEGQFSINLEGIIDPESGRISALARLGYYYGRDCGYAIADRIDKKNLFTSPPANSIDTIIDYVEENSYTEKSLKGMNDIGLCATHINQWLSQLSSYNFRSWASNVYPEFAAYDLLTDEKFQHYFGKPFEELSSNSLGELSFQLSNGCANNYLTNDVRGLTTGKVFSALTGVVRNTRGFHRGNFIIYPFARRALESWRAHAVSLINQSNSYDSIIKEVPWRTFTLLWPSDGLTLDYAFLERKSIDIIDKLQATLDSKNNDFRRLYVLSTFLDPYVRNGITPIIKQEAKAKISKRLNKHLIPSSTIFLNGLVTADDVTSNLNENIETGRYRRFADYVDDKVLSKVNELFSNRRKQLVKGFILNEETYVKDIMDDDSSNIQKLQAMVFQDDSIRIKYSSILSDPGFVYFLHEHERNRVNLINESIDGISQEITASKNKKELREVYDRYVAIYYSKNNLPDSVKKLDVIYLEVLKRFEPFHGLPGFEYLDAIYQGDYELMRQLDFIYQRIAIESTNSRLTEAFGISLGRSELAIAGAAVQKNSLIDPIIATYMFNYSEKSKRCLRPDSGTFSVSITEVTTTRNGLGDYIATNYGPTNVTKYTVNKEFSDAFRKVYKLSTNPLVFKGIDPINGTKKIFNQDDFLCDSPQIKIFEKNLIKLFNRHHGYY